VRFVSDTARGINRRRPLARGAQLLQENILFTTLFAVGTLLRIVVFFTYQPALLLQRDTIAFLRQALHGSPSGLRPSLYPTVIKPALALNNLALVPFIQHAMGMAVALLLYVLLRRLGASANLSALGAAPILLDGYQLIIEQYVLTETLFDALVVSAAAVLLWRAPPHPAALAAVGALLALSGLTRFVGLVLIGPVLFFAVVRRFGWLRVCCLSLGFVLPLVAYLTWFRVAEGSWGLTNRNGFILYGRVASFASCEGVEVPPSQADLCIKHPPRQGFANRGFWALEVPRDLIESPDANHIFLSFSRRMIIAKPLQYAGAVGSDWLRFFAARSPPSQEPYVARWRFPRTLEDVNPHPVVRALRGSAPPRLDLAEFRIVPGPAAALRLYQGVVYTYGPLLGALLFAGLAGSGAFRQKWRDDHQAVACLLFSLLTVVALLAPVVTTVYHYRYVLPALPLAGAAGALGATRLARRWAPGPRRADPGPRLRQS
jgi:4-amino-4-deoxy-L-arabinose transferase-like glycosyltransferase